MEVKTSENDFYNFKPLYTLQPVKLTREKQLRQWNEIILRHCKDNDIRTINPFSFPLFSNISIDRKLSIEGIGAVIDHLIRRGKGYDMISDKDLFSVKHRLFIQHTI
jgi:hypothetical protein